MKTSESSDIFYLRFWEQPLVWLLVRWPMGCNKVRQRKLLAKFNVGLMEFNVKIFIKVSEVGPIPSVTIRYAEIRGVYQ